MGGGPAWLETCLASVAAWAAGAGHGWRRLGDELFDPLPGWALAAAAMTLPNAPFALVRERWLWREGGRVCADERVGNAAMLFTRAGGLLDWYPGAAETILRGAPKPLDRTAPGPSCSPLWPRIAASPCWTRSPRSSPR